MPAGREPKGLVPSPGSDGRAMRAVSSQPHPRGPRKSKIPTRRGSQSPGGCPRQPQARGSPLWRGRCSAEQRVGATSAPARRGLGQHGSPAPGVPGALSGLTLCLGATRALLPPAGMEARLTVGSLVPSGQQVLLNRWDSAEGWEGLRMAWERGVSTQLTSATGTCGAWPSLCVPLTSLVIPAHALHPLPFSPAQSRDKTQPAESQPTHTCTLRGTGRRELSSALKVEGR